MSATPVKFWIDNAWEKHECFPYDRSVGSRVVRHDGREITLLLPEWTPQFKVVHISSDDDVLFVLGESEEEFGRGEKIGALLVARRQPTAEGEASAPETYIVHVLHSLYPGALKFLGLKTATGATPEAAESTGVGSRDG